MSELKQIAFLFEKSFSPHPFQDILLRAVEENYFPLDAPQQQQLSLDIPEFLSKKEQRLRQRFKEVENNSLCTEKQKRSKVASLFQTFKSLDAITKQYREKAQDGKGYIYIIERFNNSIKLGQSDVPYNRLSNLTNDILNLSDYGIKCYAILKEPHVNYFKWEQTLFKFIFFNQRRKRHDGKNSEVLNISLNTFIKTLALYVK